jgi:hypothetical protein
MLGFSAHSTPSKGFAGHAAPFNFAQGMLCPAYHVPIHFLQLPD